MCPPAPGSACFDVNVIAGYRVTAKNRSLLRSLSRSTFRVVTVRASIVAATLSVPAMFVGSYDTVPVGPANSPLTFATSMWRTVKVATEWSGSIVHVTAGAGIPPDSANRTRARDCTNSNTSRLGSHYPMQAGAQTDRCGGVAVDEASRPWTGRAGGGGTSSRGRPTARSNRARCGRRSVSRRPRSGWRRRGHRAPSMPHG